MIHRSDTYIFIFIVLSPIIDSTNLPSINPCAFFLQHRNSLTLERHQEVSKKQVLVLDLKLLIALLNLHDGSWMIPFRPSLAPGILGKITKNNSGVGTPFKNEHGTPKWRFGVWKIFFSFQLGNYQVPYVSSGLLRFFIAQEWLRRNDFCKLGLLNRLLIYTTWCLEEICALSKDCQHPRKL